MAANRTLTAAEREELWARLNDVRGAALTTTGGWTLGYT